MKSKKSILVLMSMCLMLTFSGMAYADYSTAHVYLGNFRTTGNSLSYYADSSVATYGYSFAVQNAAYEWSLASSSVDIDISTDSDCKCIAVYVGSHILGEGVFGSTGYFDKGLFGWNGINSSNVHSGTNFDRARIKLDDGEMDDYEFTSSNARQAAGHEFGHALSLGHFEDAPAHTGDHWMKSGIISLTAPTTTDKDHLKNKWGN